MHFSSELLEKAVEVFSKLPGIGKKTALRMVLHLLKQEESFSEEFGNTIIRLRKEIQYCKNCHNISDANYCSICSNPLRNKQLICVVETIRDVIAIENTQQFNGTYHVLGGVISPIDGIGPDKLNIESLIDRIKQEATSELLFALNANIQGDTTVYYIQQKLQGTNIKVTTIARGIAFGGELEYADEMTLARSLQNRVPVESFLKR